MLGTVDHHGRVRTLRGHGPPLAAIAGHDRQIGKGKRMRCPLVTRYVHLIFSLFLIHSIAHNIILDKIRWTTLASGHKEMTFEIHFLFSSLRLQVCTGSRWKRRIS
jgi:hypothetical protein